jgi:hypothetical protein
VEEATNIRHKILYNLKLQNGFPPGSATRLAQVRHRGSMRHGVELAKLAGAIGEIARQTPKNDFRSIHPQEAQIILLDAPRPRMPGSAKHVFPSAPF